MGVQKELWAHRNQIVSNPIFPTVYLLMVPSIYCPVLKIDRKKILTLLKQSALSARVSDQQNRMKKVEIKLNY